MKKIIFIILFFNFSGFSVCQDLPLKYSEAIKEYNSGNFIIAHKLFNDFISQGFVDNNLISSARFYSAQSLIAIGQKNGAADEFKSFLDNYKFSAFREHAYYKLGVIYYELNRYELCRNTLTDLLEEYPYSQYTGSAYFMIGETFTNENKVQEAEKFFKDAISSKRNNRFIEFSIYALANLYEKNGEYSKAITYYDRLLAFHSDSELAPLAQSRIGLCYYKQNDLENSILELTDQKIAELSEEIQVESKYVLANAYYRLKEYDNAELVYKEIIKSYPNSSKKREAEYGLAWVYFQRSLFNDSYTVFSNLANSGKDSIAVKSFFWSAESKRYAGNSEDAIEIYNLFLEKYPSSPLVDEVKLNIGLTHFNEKENKISEDYLLASIKSNDKFTRARGFTLLGEIRLQGKKYSDAKNYFSDALQIEGIGQDIKNRAELGLGIAEFFLDNFDRSISHLTQLNTRDSDFESDKVNFYIAEGFAAKQEYNRALNFYNRINSENEELVSQILFGKGYAYYNTKDFANAIFYFSEFSDKYKSNSNYQESVIRLADSYYGAKKFGDAAKYYKQVINIQGSRINTEYAHYQLAQSYYRSGNSNAAIQEFKIIQEKYPRSKYVDEAQYLIGWIYFQQGNFNTAISNYKNLIAKYPNSNITPIALYSIGDSYFNLGNYDSSITFYNKLIAEYPNTNFMYDAVNGIQYAYVVQDKPENAIAFIDNFIDSNPNFSLIDQIYYKKGEIYYSLGEYERAKNVYNQFLVLYPNSKLIPDSYYWLAKCAANLGQKTEALKFFDYVIGSYLNSEIGIASVIESGKIYSEMQNYEAAFSLYDRAISTLGKSEQAAEIHFLKAQTQIEIKDIPGAYETLNFIIQSYINTIFSSKAKLELGILEIERKSFSGAEMLFKELAENHADDIGAKAQYYLGISLMEQNKLNDAIIAFVRVRNVFPIYDEWSTKSLLQLGTVYEKLNDNEKAKEMYRTVITKHRNDSYGKEAQEKLRRLQ